MKSLSQERDELKMNMESFEDQLKASAEEKAAMDKEFSDTKQEFQSVKSHLTELKENLQIEQKEKEVSVKCKGKVVWGQTGPHCRSLSRFL